MPGEFVVLKPGKEKPVLHRHHWIFSGAIQSLPKFADGDILPVRSSQGAFLGRGYFNRKSSIIGRMLAFDDTPPLEVIRRNIDGAASFRETLFDPMITNAYRLINGEGDRLPGLIVDRYDKLLVIQISTLGMERLKDTVVSILQERCRPEAIYEKSTLPSRREEGLHDLSGWLSGRPVEEVEVRENGLRFLIAPEQGQKTGFFLDHRDMRQLVRTLAAGKRVLNAFAYTGGFTVYALAGGASSVDSVDISGQAVEMARRHVVLNGFDAGQQGFYTADVFQFLRERELNYDLVVLDPPAFAKRKKDVISACRGYKDINRLAMQKMGSKTLLLTCSCSHHVDEGLFQQVVFQAASEAKRNVRIIGRHRLAPDHPVNIFHPESDYLKSFLLYLD